MGLLSVAQKLQAFKELEPVSSFRGRPWDMWSELIKGLKRLFRELEWQTHTAVNQESE